MITMPSPSPGLKSTARDKSLSHESVPTVITIGGSRLFDELKTRIRELAFDQKSEHFETLREAVDFLAITPALPQLAVVFREWCDEHPQQLVQDFIGRMFFRRVVCCEGPLCVSEARTHQYWPAACRTSPAAAPLIISRHLQQLVSGRSALSHLAGAEDVFTAEVTAASDRVPAGLQSPRAFIVASDATLRQTLLAILRSSEIPAEAGDADVLQLLSEHPAGRPDWVLVDADQSGIPDVLLSQLKQAGVLVLALTGFPAKSCPEWASQRVDKTEILLQLATLSMNTLS
jgi:hypothetical protein